MENAADRQHLPLTALDWQVVEIARRERPHAALAEGRLARLLRAIFSHPIAPALANGKLEALRCFCMHAWHRTVIPGHCGRALISAGYTVPNVAEILSHVRNFRGSVPVLQEEIVG
jgi:hypothetical protein